MSDVQSLSSSPSSAASSDSAMGSSLLWEKVSLSPLEMLSVQLENDLQQLQDSFVAGKQNKQGVDLDPRTGKAGGRVTLDVLAAKGLDAVLLMHPVLTNVTQEPLVVVATTITPSTACEKQTKKHLRTTGAPVKHGRAQWSETLEYAGIKNKNFVVKLSLSCSSGIIADVMLGELELNSNSFLDQLTHEQWFTLKAPASAAPDTEAAVALVEVLLRVKFTHNAAERHERVIAELSKKRKENDEAIEQYKNTARAIQAHVQHPAAFGSETAQAALYIPGHNFSVDAHHPAAVSTLPLADKTRVVTPFGRGTIIAFRKESKMYMVQMDTDSAAKNPTIAYLRQKDVTEEPDEPHFRMHMQVATPYGHGHIEEIRPHDGVFIVQAPFGRMFMQRRDVKLPEKAIGEMTTKDLIAEAISQTETGNEQFRQSDLAEAVMSYLRALGYLQRVDQDGATHKEKATMIQTMIRCHLNISACKLKMDAYYDAEIASTNALGILTAIGENRTGNVVTWMGRLGLSEQLMFEEWPSKARFRRAQACAKQGKYADAKQDLLIAAKLCPKDKSCRALLEQVTKIVAKQKSDEKKAWGGFLEQKTDEITSTSTTTTKTSGATTTTTTTTTSKTSDSSIFVRKTKAQREKEALAKRATAAAAVSADPWYLSSKVLATASVMTAGIAAVALLSMKQQNH